MKLQQIEVKNKLGLHARAANKLVEVTGRYTSKIRIKHTHQSDWVNAKSIMSVMLLAAPIGSRLDLEVSGDDEDTAIAAIEAIFEEKFGEDE